MAYIKIYENKIKRRASLKECTEFHFTDVDLCYGGGEKLIAQYYLDGISKCRFTPVYSSMLGGGGNWSRQKTQEYVYAVIAWETDEIWPEEALDLCMSFHEEFISELPTLISIHEDENCVYAHMLIRKVDYFKETVELNIREFFSEGANYLGHDIELAENGKIPNEMRIYFDMMGYLMY